MSKQFIAELRKEKTLEAVTLRADQLKNEYPEHVQTIAKADLKVSAEKMMGK